MQFVAATRRDSVCVPGGLRDGAKQFREQSRCVGAWGQLEAEEDESSMFIDT